MSLLETKRKLRMVTYLCPEMPVMLYATYQRYLEAALGCHSYLMVEANQRPPQPAGLDPFSLDEVDIAFTHSRWYMRLHDEGTPHMELLPVAPIHIHSKSRLQPVYFSEVIVHKANIGKYKEFLDLKGHIWGYDDEESVSGSVQILAELKRQGFNASFFGNIIHTGSAVNSIEQVLNKSVDVAAVDSSVLEQYLLQRPSQRERLHVLASLGPIPIQPILVNSRMAAQDKRLIVDKLLQMNASEKWQAELAKFNVWGFKPVEPTLYSNHAEATSQHKGLSLHTAYY